MEYSTNTSSHQQGAQEAQIDPNTLTRYLSAVLRMPIGEVADIVGFDLGYDAEAHNSGPTFITANPERTVVLFLAPQSSQSSDKNTGG